MDDVLVHCLSPQKKIARNGMEKKHWFMKLKKNNTKNNRDRGKKGGEKRREERDRRM